MKRHVLLTGEIGAGKSTALRAALARMEIRADGIETYSPQPRGVLPKTLYLRAYGEERQGMLLCILPDGDKSGVTRAFDAEAARLLLQAKDTADVIVIDEIGRLERDAHAYHDALRACFDGPAPVLGAIRKHKADWADWIREREDVLLLEVTRENRDALPAMVARCLRDALSDA